MVSEESMLPAYKQGDHILTLNWGKIKVGDVVVFSDDKSRVYFIKRIYKKVYNNVYICGDNVAKSAKMKPIERAQIVGKVVFKY